MTRERAAIVTVARICNKILSTLGDVIDEEDILLYFMNNLNQNDNKDIDEVHQMEDIRKYIFDKRRG